VSSIAAAGSERENDVLSYHLGERCIIFRDHPDLASSWPCIGKLNGIAGFANPYIRLAGKQSATDYYAVSNIDFPTWSRTTSACAQAVVF
jgi:hypothetical protein